MKLVPQVQSLVYKEGFFKLSSSSRSIWLSGESPQIAHAAGLLTKEIKAVLPGHGFRIRAGRPAQQEGIILECNFSREKSESYRMTISGKTAELRGDGPAGLFYGVQTLRQLIRIHGSKLPCLEISDSPDFPRRGFYHDVTRGKVPTLDTLKLLVDTLAFYKINEFQMYVEHSFAFKGMPELWKDKDPLTPPEIKELDAYCRLNFIDLVPSLATFGHLYELLRIKRFEHLNELEMAASKLPLNLWDRMAHYTIDPCNEESFRVIRGMIDEYAPLFSSRRFNICCDETFDLGRGRNALMARKLGVEKLYAGFVNKLIDAVRKQGKQPMLWADIVLRRPGLIKEFPGETLFLNWAYGADVSGSAAESLARAGARQYVCPGVHGWSRFANEINTASANIRSMVAFGGTYGAEGVLTTDWGDCGHVNFLAGSFHGMALGAALSWNSSSFQENRDFDEAFSAMQWNDGTGAIAVNLRQLGSLCPYHFGNIYAWVNGLDCMWNREKFVAEMDPLELAGCHGRAKAIKGFFKRRARLIRRAGMGRPGKKRNVSGRVQDIAEFVQSAAEIEWTLALLAFKKRNEYGQKACPEIFGNTEKLIAAGRKILKEFRRLWLVRNKESELRNVVETFEKVFEKIESLDPRTAT